MWDMIYALGIGISFAVGVGMGAFLCRIATREGRKDINDEWKDHQKVVEERLGNYVIHTEMIAKHLGKIAEKQQEE